MDYNTQREKLIMPEHGRHVQKMIDYIVNIPDKEKRNEQVRVLIGIMGSLNPTLRDLEDFRHKLWDHVHIISDFKIDIDSPYPTPSEETFSTKPNPIPLDKSPLRAAHYGRNIQNMVDLIASKEDGEEKDRMIVSLANYMRHQYLIWNKDSVSDETIFDDMVELSRGKITIPEGAELPSLHQGGQSQQAHGNQRGGRQGGGKRRQSKRNGNR